MVLRRRRPVSIASGYLTNVAGYQALDSLYKIDAVFVDERAHYSVIDYSPVIGKPVYTFAHRDPEDLKKKLQQHLKPGQKPLVVSDGVFPLFGRLAPLPAYFEVTEDSTPASKVSRVLAARLRLDCSLLVTPMIWPNSPALCIKPTISALSPDCEMATSRVSPYRTIQSPATAPLSPPNAK